MILFGEGPLPFGLLGSQDTHFVRGDMGLHLFHFRLSASTRSLHAIAGSNKKRYKCACESYSKKATIGGKMNAAKTFAQAVVLLLAVLIAGVAWAQTSNGTLVGSVTDP